MDPLSINDNPENFGGPTGNDEGTGPSTEGGDDIAQEVLQQFGEDPAALARAFAELNHKVGSMANELGTLRAKAEIADKLLEKGLAGGEAAAEERDPVSALAEELRAKAEAGEDVLEPLLAGVRKIVEKEVAPIKQQAKAVNAELLYERFVAAHPDAEKYTEAMKQAFNEMPWILPTDSGEQAFMKGLEALYTLVKSRTGGGRASGALDGRRRTGIGIGREGTSSRRDINRAFTKAVKSGSTEAWKDVIESVLFSES